MKKFLFIASLVLLVCGLGVSAAFLVMYNPFKTTLTEIGMNNQPLYIVWGVMTGAAVWLNTRIMSRRLGVNNKLINVLLGIGCVSIVLSVLVYKGNAFEMRFLNGDTLSHFHRTFAVIFGVLCAFSVLATLWAASGKKRDRLPCRIAVVILLLVCIIDVVSIIFCGLTLFCELFALLFFQIVMFFFNFVLKIGAKTIAI